MHIVYRICTGVRLSACLDVTCELVLSADLACFMASSVMLTLERVMPPYMGILTNGFHHHCAGSLPQCVMVDTALLKRLGAFLDSCRSCFPCCV